MKGILNGGCVAGHAFLVWTLSIRIVCGQGGITEEGPYTVFRSGGGEPLLTRDMSLAIPDVSASPFLKFTFGFATEEPDTPDTFFDSFSVTLQTGDSSATALLLTADRTGVRWAPETPGGIGISLDWLEVIDADFPELSPALELRYSYSLTLELPPEMTGQGGLLYFDLFDNANEFESLAFFSGVEIESSVVAGPMALQSSASVSGPFADEAGAVFDLTDRTIRLPGFGARRFFQLRSDVPPLITRLAIEAGELVFAYGFVPGAFRVLSASEVTGPYEEVGAAAVDYRARLILIPGPEGARFYQIESDAEVRVTGLRREGAQLLMEFEFLPQPVELWSSASLEGPYAPESGVRAASDRPELRMNRNGGARFYRIRGGAGVRIAGMEREGGDLVFQFE